MKSGRSIFKMSRSQWIGVAVLASSLGLAAAVTVPNTFTAGTPISASAMNANFAALANAVPAISTQSASILGAQINEDTLLHDDDGRTFCFLQQVGFDSGGAVGAGPGLAGCQIRSDLQPGKFVLRASRSPTTTNAVVSCAASCLTW